MSDFNDSTLTDTDFLHFNSDYMKVYRGTSKVVLFPNSTEQISQILKHCHENKIAVVPQSGNTGLVGGSTPVHDEIVIHMGKFNKIINFDEISETLHCESGVVLENLNQYLGERGYTPPVDLGAKGSCYIGGNISTNAGGIHFIKFGSLRKNVKGIKAVLANGEIIDCMNPLPKNNTGYDLKHMFIGSEGTLGIVTECLLNCFPIPQYKTLSIMKLKSFDDILKVYTEAKKLFGESVYAMEFFDEDSLYLQVKHNNQKNPFNEDTLDRTKPKAFYLLLEIGNHKENQEDMMNFIEQLSEEELLEDAVIPEDNTKTREIWELRESILESTVKAGPSVAYDVSLSLDKFYYLVEKIQEFSSKKNFFAHGYGHIVSLSLDKFYYLVEKIQEFSSKKNFFAHGYGHIGDYNLHINIVDMDPDFNKRNDFSRVQAFKKEVEKELFGYIHSINGSISAEHGIGRQKTKFLHYTQPQLNIDLMKSIKKTYDPNGILNPYKIL
eukprot:CAMPEP_0170535800 /NCGR_PEP_ID=MMETSP0209-20121228/101796_1 /TAXON_ID=665100 ORGANISM="Litonotus pictus, Strain P1" /NCGR_SAMPLE_ID=MMETSP0209 /ASSEMBLY_ACC=CAM_ASM_000301 /LENGTH=494 /DNA_ID=CAMNT_0010837099 /DNA_START=258 /DNA_END=1743 /DNA_ORIENTATION=-